MTEAPLRVLVVDDSAFARKVLRQVLSAVPGIQVVDTARDGLDALEKIAALKPDVVTLDLVMPHLDGLGVLRALAGAPSPRVVVVSSAGEETGLAVSALQAGAVDLVHKPTALATDRLYELGAGKSPGYTEALAKRLDAHSALEVLEAGDAMELRPGRAVLARSGMHLRVERDGTRAWTRLDRLPLDTPHHPSVDVLFQSAAAGWGVDAVGLVLTGMGDDGLVGAGAIRKAGGCVLTQSAGSCVVYGMPRVVDDARLSQASAPLEQLAALLGRYVR